MNKTPSKDNINLSDDDFSNSMARLAELAAQGIVDKKPNDGRLDLDATEMKQFLTPKRKKKEEKEIKSYSQIVIGRSIKIKINPYVASGILVAIISTGLLAAPRIAKYWEEKNTLAETRKVKSVQVASNTEKKLKTYTVFDAVSDAGGGRELEAMSISELALKVQEMNVRMETKELSKHSIMEQNNSDANLAFSVDYKDNSSVYSFLQISSTNDSWERYDLHLPENLAFSKFELCASKINVPSETENQQIYVDIIQKLGISFSAESTMLPTCSTEL
jgi:hypothetical protein